jgi:hypothetical protein
MATLFIEAQECSAYLVSSVGSSGRQESPPVRRKKTAYEMRLGAGQEPHDGLEKSTDDSSQLSTHFADVLHGVAG